jgi:6-phosphogluconolactonase
VAVLAFGEAKRDAVSRALECQALPGSMPVQLVRPTHGKVTYVLDAASAAGLSTAVWDDWKKWPRSEIPRAAK